MVCDEQSNIFKKFHKQLSLIIKTVFKTNFNLILVFLWKNSRWWLLNVIKITKSKHKQLQQNTKLLQLKHYHHHQQLPSFRKPGQHYKILKKKKTKKHVNKFLCRHFLPPESSSSFFVFYFLHHICRIS